MSLVHEGRLGALLCALVLLTACGGGGGSGASPPVSPGSVGAGPTATPAPSAPPQTLAVDCSAATNLCAPLSIPGDPPDTSGFHGYADPSMRTNPSSGVLELAYSWPRVLSDGTHVVDLHVAHSGDGGTTWQYDGPLFTTAPFANPGTGNYAAANRTSNEVVDLLPIAVNGSHLWVQAHLAYLVPAGGKSVYAQLNPTNYLSVSAVVDAGTASLTQLSAAKEARLGNAGTDSTLQPTVNLSSMNSVVSRCVHFDQPTFAMAGSTLYLATQCFESSGNGDGTNLAFAVFSTQPNGADATKWSWSYAGEFATQAQAQALGAVESTPYQFFTELQLTTSRSGQLLAVLTPGIASTTGQQPSIQYGCRAIPVMSLAPPTLQTNASGVVAVAAKVTASDLYAGPNEGPGACSYDPDSSTGIVMVRKLEADPTLGFYLTLQASGLRP